MLDATANCALARDIQQEQCRGYVHEMLQSPPDGVMLVARLVPSGFKPYLLYLSSAMSRVY